MVLFGKKKDGGKVPGEALGIFLFDEVSSAIRAEKVLKAAQYECALVAPPFELRGGCDLAVTVPTVERMGAERALADAGVHVRDWAGSLEGAADLVDLVTTEDLGAWFMVRAGNMKITVEKSSGLIVNTSGGGCPDIPYLNLELVGTTLAEAPRPRDLGYTLCGVMLDRAFAEAERVLAEGGSAS